MSAINAFFPVDAAIKATDTFNDVMGAKDNGLWRTVSGLAQGAVYGNLGRLAGDKAIDAARDIKTALEGKHYGDAAVGLIPLAGYGASMTLMATFAGAAVATAIDTKLADKRAARVS